MGLKSTVLLVNQHSPHSIGAPYNEIVASVNIGKVDYDFHDLFEEELKGGIYNTIIACDDEDLQLTIDSTTTTKSRTGEHLMCTDDLFIVYGWIVKYIRKKQYDLRIEMLLNIILNAFDDNDVNEKWGDRYILVDCIS